MRSMIPFFGAVAILTTLAGCGTKTPLTLPPQQAPAKSPLASMDSAETSVKDSTLADNRGMCPTATIR